jgi:hypothetical protein
MDAKRRLPVLQAASGEPEVVRPPWQWVLFGALIVVAAWLPLQVLAGAIKHRLRGGHPPGPVGEISPETAAFLDSMLVLVAAAFLGGFVVGKWGQHAVKPRHAALSGLVASSAFAAAAMVWFGTPPLAFVVTLIATPAAWLGGFVGSRRRSPI